MRLLSEDLSANAEEAEDTMRSSRNGASSVLTGLEHSVLDSLCLKRGKGFVSLFSGESHDCFFFSIQLLPLSGENPVFLD